MNYKERNDSYFINMRKYHNLIKRDLYDRYAKNTNNLLDLACGKCGDLNKYISNNVKNVFGYDISKESIQECNKRIKRANASNIIVNIKDLSSEIISCLKPEKMDVITCMFAFHYFFESEKTFNTIMTSILNNIKDDGIFMGCLFNGDSLESVKLDDYFILNKYDTKNESIFGNKISVYIKDTVLNEPMDEYIVYFNNFVELMKTHNFELVESKMFNEYIQQFKPKLTEIESYISFLNRTFVFKKKSNKCKNINKYLTECEWSIEEKKQILYERYIEALNENLDGELNDKKKEIYTLIITNFANPKVIMQSDINNAYKIYYKEIYLGYKKIKDGLLSA